MNGQLLKVFLKVGAKRNMVDHQILGPPVEGNRQEGHDPKRPIRSKPSEHVQRTQIDMEYDTMILGHWHQLIQLERLIVNGSLKGYDEYAYANNFGFEPPRQALWITHPEHGLTFSMPVYVERKQKQLNKEWITWK